MPKLPGPTPNPPTKFGGACRAERDTRNDPCLGRMSFPARNRGKYCRFYKCPQTKVWGRHYFGVYGKFLQILHVQVSEAANIGNTQIKVRFYLGICDNGKLFGGLRCRGKKILNADTTSPLHVGQLLSDAVAQPENRSCPQGTSASVQTWQSRLNPHHRLNLPIPIDRGCAGGLHVSREDVLTDSVLTSVSPRNEADA
jgi:hypothetical protein